MLLVETSFIHHGVKTVVFFKKKVITSNQTALVVTIGLQQLLYVIWHMHVHLDLACIFYIIYKLHVHLYFALQNRPSYLHYVDDQRVAEGPIQVDALIGNYVLQQHNTVDSL